MLSLKEIMKQITVQLKTFDIDINSKDIKEGFLRPSFFVKFENVGKIDYLNNFKRRLTVRIFYFPESRYEYTIETLEKTEELEDLFKLGIKIDDRYLKVVDGIETDVIDGVLQVWFDIEFFDSSEHTVEVEKMGEIYVRD